MKKGFALGVWIIPILVIIAVLSVRFLTDVYFSSSKSVTSKSHEAFSTVNMAELYEKSLSESMQVFGKKAAYDAAKRGGGIEFWTPDITQEQIKAELEKAIKNEFDNNLKKIEIPGKGAEISFSDAEVKITPGTDWLASIEFTADVKKPFELDRKLQSINAFFNLKDSGDFSEKFPLRYFAMAETGRKSFSDFKYGETFDNELKKLRTTGSVTACGSCPGEWEPLGQTDYGKIEEVVRNVVSNMNDYASKNYPYLVFEFKITEVTTKNPEIVSTGTEGGSCCAWSC